MNVMPITAKELAEKLNGRQYREEITDTEELVAKWNRLVVMFGASDDLMEFRWAIDDEIGCYGWAVVRFLDQKLFQREDPFGDEEEQIDFLEKYWINIKDVILVSRSGISCSPWDYETMIPHEKFKVMEEWDVYGYGLVFSLDSLTKIK